MDNITISCIDSNNISGVIPGIVNVFRDDEVVPWHRHDRCLAWITRRTERGFYITLAYNGDKIAGYSEWIVTYDSGKKILYLGIMQVDIDLRGRGIGKAMLDDGEKYAKSIGASYLRTIPEDDRSYNFYRKYGFAQTDVIYYCACPTKAGTRSEQSGNPAAVTLEIADTNEFVFGFCQSSGRHMFEVANHNPETGEFEVITCYIPGGYLQFRYREGTKTALALYWSNKKITSDIISAILAKGHAEGFEEIEFYFKSKYADLFAEYNIVRESIEIERKI